MTPEEIISQYTDFYVGIENPDHDYPQKITYKKVNDTNIMATISGRQQGKPTSESFKMTKN